MRTIGLAWIGLVFIAAPVLADPTYTAGDVFDATAVVLDTANLPFASIPAGVSLRWTTSNSAVASFVSVPEGGAVVMRAVGPGEASVRCRLTVGALDRVGGAVLRVVSNATPGRTPGNVSVILEPARTPTPTTLGQTSRRHFAQR